MTGVLRVILAVTMGVATCRETFGQMTVYRSRTFLLAEFPPGSITSAMLLGKQMILPQERL
jgi:hypothetical protein